MDGWMDTLMDKWTNWVDNGLIDDHDGCICGMDGLIDGWINGWIDGIPFVS